MFCGYPVRGEQNGIKIFYYFGDYLFAEVIRTDAAQCDALRPYNGK